jgi:hypothetical protein
MCSEYMVVRKLTSPRRGMNCIDFVKAAVIRVISLSKLIEGGAAMLAAVNKNHHIDIIGLMVINPLVRNILRV